MDQMISTELPEPNVEFRREIYSRIGNQRLAARALGISEGHLSDIVNGWILPGRDLALRASSLFGKPVEELFPNLR
jgi:plasmid maintenance system antidote protein VapI